MELVIIGWKPGLKAISVVYALRRYGAMGLTEAKRALDGLLDDEPIHLSLEREALPKAREEFEAFG